MDCFVHFLFVLWLLSTANCVITWFLFTYQLNCYHLTSNVISRETYFDEVQPNCDFGCIDMWTRQTKRQFFCTDLLVMIRWRTMSSFTDLINQWYWQSFFLLSDSRELYMPSLTNEWRVLVLISARYSELGRVMIHFVKVCDGMRVWIAYALFHGEF